MLKKIITFIKALKKHSTGGFKKVPTEVWAYRYETCMECPYMERTNPETCGCCGCVIYTKTEWASEKCPRDKWKEYKS